jgi:hypothetical protein
MGIWAPPMQDTRDIWIKNTIHQNMRRAAIQMILERQLGKVGLDLTVYITSQSCISFNRISIQSLDYFPQLGGYIALQNLTFCITHYMFLNIRSFYTTNITSLLNFFTNKYNVK